MSSRWTRFPAVGLVALLLVCTPVLIGQERPQGPPPGAPQAAAGDQATGAKDDPEGDQQPGTAAAVPPPSGVQPGSTTIRSPMPAPRSGRSQWPSAVIREPSQGRPIFRAPGETFYFVMRLPPGVSGEVSFTLRLAQEPGIRIPLRPTTPPSYVNNEYCSLVLEVPTGTAPGLYDLEVRSPAASYYSRRSVKVIDSFKTRFRFVHLSNMNIGDLTAPDFDELLPQEINLLAPEFIIATGDYTEWARARDDASSWIRVLEFFEAFNAPVFMLCGLHDHEASFSDVVASKPIGTIDYGGYHGLLLLDHPGNPIDQDYDQLEWIETDLRRNRDKRFNFIAANSDELALLDVWRERGDVAEFVKKHKIKMFIVGGSTDWDYREFAQKLAGLDDLHFIRTHQASTSLRDRATGFSHYRVIEVDGDQITYIYPNDNARENLAHSIPTGRLRAFYDAPNDGSSQRVGVTVQNALNQGFKDVHLWLRVAKGPGGGPPKIAPGRVARVLDAGHYWACDVVVDLPDKGGLRVVASTNPADLPPARPITVELGGPRDWTFEPRTTNFGLSYFTCQAPASLILTNHSDQDQTCWPVVRINGAQLHPDRTVCPRLPLTIKSGASVSVPLVLNLRRVSPGRHAMQVYFLEDPLCRLTTFDVEMGHRQQAAGDADRLP